MADINDLLKIPEQLRIMDWSKKDAILTGTFINLLSVGSLNIALRAIKVDLSAKQSIYIFVGFEILIILAWVIRRYLVAYDPKTISVGFAVTTNTESAKIYKSLQENFRRYINDNNLGDLVSIKRLPSDLSFKSDKQAEKYFDNRGLRVLIWGDTSVETVNNEPTTIFNIRVTSHITSANQQLTEELKTILKNGIQRGFWSVQHSQSLLGVSLVGDNILEICLYALGVTMISDPRLDYAIRGNELLEYVYKKLSNRGSDDNFRNLEVVKKQTADLLMHSCVSITNIYLFDRKDPKNALIYAVKSVAIKPDEYMGNILLARLYWENGDQRQAYHFTSVAASLGPNETLHHMNFGFFGLCDGNYKYAIAQYKLIDSSVYKTNISEVTDFLLNEFDKTHKHALIFGAGWLNVKYGDKVLGKEYLLEFKKNIGNDNNYSVLIREANKQIQKLDKH